MPCPAPPEVSDAQAGVLSFLDVARVGAVRRAACAEPCSQRKKAAKQKQQLEKSRWLEMV